MTAPPPCEIGWFSAPCDDDYEFPGVPEASLQSSREHCRDIVLQAESGGYDNVLLPSGYTLEIDTTAFAAASAPLLKRRRSSAIPIRSSPSSRPIAPRGIDAFILSGYPHSAEADLFARHGLPRVDHGPLIL